jgi:uracil-DNA glycosylase
MPKATSNDASKNSGSRGKGEPSPTTAINNSDTAQVQAVAEATLANLEQQTMGESWYTALSAEFQKPYFVKLKSFLQTEQASCTIYPPLHDIYSWSRLTPLNEVKVVILGQDPYHDKGQAHGLAFSVLPPTKPPPSLKNIYKQLASDIPDFVVPQSGDLSPVARQGVLWLNTSLTVRAHKAGSHAKKGWETFTSQVLHAVLDHSKNNGGAGVVFMLWGNPAQKAVKDLKIDEKKHLILKSAHPSPLSANRGFLGNGHFKQANEWLCDKYGEGVGVNWPILNPSANK